MGLVLATSSLVWAEEGTTAAEDQARPQTTRKVLQDPHDISSFYRQSQSSPFVGVGVYPEEYGYEAYGDHGHDDYAIAGYYRQNGGHGRYPISSFYRNEGDPGRYPIASFYRNQGDGRYPIAGFYRQGAYGRYGAFWNAPTYSPRVGYVQGGYRRVRARELCMVAPTVLFPFVPVVTDVR